MAAALLLTSSLEFLEVTIPWWIDAPSVMGFYGIVYSWFDKSLWYQKPFSFSLSSIPNLQGTWVGTIHSSYGNGTTVPGIILYIHQTWTAINIRIVTEKSSSYSIMAAVNTHESSQPSLKYEYMNEPSALSSEEMNTHRGTANLQLSPNGKELTGDYFTGRGRQTLGTMEFRLISRDYLDRAVAISISQTP